MGIAFQIVSALLILGAVFLFLKNARESTAVTKGQKALSVFQIILCGWYFALCVSDVLDIRVNFSAVRVVLNIFYGLTFLSLTVFAMTDLESKKKAQMLAIVYACAALIAVQCFVFPYGSGTEAKRILEAVEGIIVFALLLFIANRIGDERFCRSSLVAIIVLELAVSVTNTFIPMASITEDYQTSDIPLNYAALYMRPVIFSSLALIYRVWMDIRKAEKA
jgi:hypothetical protein